MTNVRVRFAPSPTGTLHLGSARSALYNWLYARHFGGDGTYVLRIEDTDQQRSTPEHVAQALRVFRWLGLDWDEGPDVDGPYAPYFQSQRGDLYAVALASLRERGLAYECFCTPDQLNADRAAATAAKRPFVYSGRCRAIDPAERAQRAAVGEAHVIRFQVPDRGDTVVNDLILGETSFQNELIGDFVIARADGSPLYNFANVVDDAAMKITHVIRGNDHLSNTPRQVLLYQALGETVPLFAHVPMILGPDGAKLSKRRHHTANVEELAQEGYHPEAVRNGLALLGWSRDADTTIMSTADLIESFDVTRVKKSPAAIDYVKLKHINGEHLRAMPADEWTRAYGEWRSEWLDADDPLAEAAAAVTPEQALYLTQEKAATFREVPELVGFLVEPHEMVPEAWEKLTKVEQAPEVLDRTIAMLEALEPFEAGAIEQALRDLCEQMEQKPRVVFGPIRFAVTGRVITPGLFESIAVLGRERALERLREARGRLAAVNA